MIGKRDRDRYVSFARNPYGRMKGWLGDHLFRKLFSNSAWLLGAQGIAGLIGVGGLILKTRSLGPEGFGHLTVVLAYIGIVGAFSSFQSWQAVIKFGADALHEGDKSRFMGYVKLGFMVDACGAFLGGSLAIAGAFLLSDWQGWSHETRLMMALGGTSLFFALSGTPTGVLRILDRFKWFTIQQASVAFLGFAGAVVVYLMGWGVKGFLFATLLSAVCGHLLLLGMALVALYKGGYLQHRAARIHEKRPFLRFSGWTYLSSTLDIPFKQFDVLIASAVISLEAAGVYRVIKQIMQIFVMMVDPIYQGVYPQFAKTIAARDDDKAIKFALKIGVIIVSVVGPVSLVAALTAKWWIGRVFGEEFMVAWFPISLVLILQIFTLPRIAVHPLFTALGYVKQNASILLFANIVYLIVAFSFSHMWGLVGLVVAWFIHANTVFSLKTIIIARGRKLALKKMQANKGESGGAP